MFNIVKAPTNFVDYWYQPYYRRRQVYFDQQQLTMQQYYRSVSANWVVGPLWTLW